MNDVDKNLSEILETEYEVLPSKEEPKQLPAVVETHNMQQDFDYSRNNYYSLLEKGNEALYGILEVARESQHPRAYEVAANMMKNLGDMTDKLMALQKQKAELEQKNNPTPTQVNVDKAVFVGSTTDLLKKIRNADSSS